MAAIRKSMSAVSNWVRVGLITKAPLMRAIRTSLIISLMGISETANAAEAAKQAKLSGIISGSLETKLINTCTSHK